MYEVQIKHIYRDWSPIIDANYDQRGVFETIGEAQAFIEKAENNPLNRKGGYRPRYRIAPHKGATDAP